MTEHEAETEFDRYLNDIYGTIEVAGVEFEASRVLYNLDSIAYRTMFHDWCDAEDIELED